MKINSYPPFIVFFDTVIILLFILILNQNKDINFKIPDDKLFSGAAIVTIVDGAFYSIDERKLIDTKKMDVFFTLPCTTQIECVRARETYYKNVYIFFPDKLTVEASKISTLALRSGCSGFIAVVGDNGFIDRKKTREENPCMSSISGIDIWLDGQL